MEVEESQYRFVNDIEQLEELWEYDVSIRTEYKAVEVIMTAHTQYGISAYLLRRMEIIANKYGFESNWIYPESDSMVIRYWFKR